MLSVKKILYKILEKPIVVENGSSGIWTYRKWSDGTSECWGRTGNNVTFAINTQYGGAYYGSAYGLESFPSGLFTNAPSISIELLGGDGCWAGINAVTATSLSFYPYCPKNGNHVCIISAHAVGRWK